MVPKIYLRCLLPVLITWCGPLIQRNMKLCAQQRLCYVFYTHFHCLISRQSQFLSFFYGEISYRDNLTIVSLCRIGIAPEFELPFSCERLNPTFFDFKGTYYSCAVNRCLSDTGATFALAQVCFREKFRSGASLLRFPILALCSFT